MIILIDAEKALTNLTFIPDKNPQKLGMEIPQPEKKHLGPSLVAQWLRICLLMQGTRV